MLFRRSSVINSEGYCPMFLRNQLQHSKLSGTLQFKKLQQRGCGETEQSGGSFSVQKWTSTLSSSYRRSIRWISTTSCRVATWLGAIKDRKRKIEESTWRDTNCEMPVLFLKLLVYKFEKLNCPPESRRCRVKRRSYKGSCRISTRRILGLMTLWTKFSLQTIPWALDVRDCSNCRRQSSKLLTDCNNLQKIVTQSIFEISRIENTSLVRETLRQSAETERLILGLPETEMETACTQSLWEHAQYALNSWSYAAEKCIQQVWDLIPLSCLPHTPLDTFLHQQLVSLLRWLGETQCKIVINNDSEEQEKYFRSYQLGRTLCKNDPNNIYTTQRSPASEDVPWVLSAR